MFAVEDCAIMTCVLYEDIKAKKAKQSKKERRVQASEPLCP